MKLSSLFRRKWNDWSDQALLKAFQEKGKEVYFDALFERYHALVYTICLNYTANREESKELTLEVFMDAYKQIKSQHIEQFDHWICVLTKNRCLTHLKKCRKEKEKREKWWNYQKNDQKFMENAAFRRLIYEEELEKDKSFQQCIALLNENQKRCINLFFFQNYSYREISEQLSMTINQVKSHLQNGKRMLKKEMIKIEIKEL